jgi:hypothetical protein
MRYKTGLSSYFEEISITSNIGKIHTQDVCVNLMKYGFGDKGVLAAAFQQVVYPEKFGMAIIWTVARSGHSYTAQQAANLVLS